MISYLANLDQSLSSLGYRDPGQVTAVTIISASGVGLISTFIFSSTIKRTLMYKNVISLCLALGTVNFIALQIFFIKL